MTDKQTTKKEGQHTTAVWRNGGFSASYDSFVVGSCSVLPLNFYAKNPPLRKAAKRRDMQSYQMTTVKFSSLTNSQPDTIFGA
jgi:hypothetical protein